MALYQILAQGILRTSDGGVIPIDGANRDYRDYLDWVAAGNTADPLVVPPNPTVIPVTAFWARLTGTEQAAIQTAAASTPTLAHVITFAMASGSINLAGGGIAAWTTALVTAGILTAARRTAILTP